MSLPIVQTVNGQELQAANTEFRLLADTGADFLVQTWKKLTYKLGAKKIPANRADGKLDAYTLGKQETSGSLSLRLSEYNAIEDWLAAQYPGVGILTIELTATVNFGNVYQKLRKDRLRLMFDEFTKEAGDDQATLMVELPLFVFDLVTNGRQAVVYGQ